MHKHILEASLAIGLGLAAAGANAATITLPLGSLTSGADILNYFDGGNDSVIRDGSYSQNLGISFSSNAEAVNATGGKFQNNPSLQSEVLYFANANPVTPNAMNFSAGFSSLSFDFSISGNNLVSGIAESGAISSESVTLWSGLDGTGTDLGSVTLTPVTNPVACSAGKSYCNWQGG